MRNAVLTWVRQGLTGKSNQLGFPPPHPTPTPVSRIFARRQRGLFISIQPWRGECRISFKELFCWTPSGLRVLFISHRSVCMLMKQSSAAGVSVFPFRTKRRGKSISGHGARSHDTFENRVQSNCSRRRWSPRGMH